MGLDETVGNELKYRTENDINEIRKIKLNVTEKNNNQLKNVFEALFYSEGQNLKVFPLEGQKVKFFTQQKYTFVKVSSILQQPLPQEIRKRLENHFFPNLRQQNLSKN